MNTVETINGWTNFWCLIHGTGEGKLLLEEFYNTKEAALKAYDANFLPEEKERHVNPRAEKRSFSEYQACIDALSDGWEDVHYMQSDEQPTVAHKDLEDLIGGIAIQFDENYRCGIRVGIVVDAFNDGSIRVVTSEKYTRWSSGSWTWAINAGTLPDQMEQDPHWLDIFKECRNLPA